MVVFMPTSCWKLAVGAPLSLRTASWSSVNHKETRSDEYQQYAEREKILGREGRRKRRGKRIVTSQSLSYCGTQEEIIISIWCNWVKFIDRDDHLSAWSLQGLKKSTSWHSWNTFNNTSMFRHSGKVNGSSGITILLTKGAKPKILFWHCHFYHCQTNEDTNISSV